MAAVAYVDSSAIVKTIIREPESAALRRYLRRYRSHASSELAVAEIIRAVRRVDVSALQRTNEALSRVTLIGVSAPVLRLAGELDPPGIRTLDAIHLASARLLAGALDVLVTYDLRMAEGAASLGIPVASPA